jgi:hypothetical protein
MSYTTEELVGEIIVINEGDDISPFIDVAHGLVEDVCLDSDYADTKLIRIETWLAAHFYACSLNLQPASERVGAVGIGYQGRTDLGFNLTHYGQMAMTIDTAGNLAALNQEIVAGKRQIVGITWLGTPLDEEEDE